MRCQELVELVSDYVDGNLSRWKRWHVESHLRECDGCDEYVEQVRIAVRSLGELPPVPADPHVREALVRAFASARPQ